MTDLCGSNVAPRRETFQVKSNLRKVERVRLRQEERMPSLRTCCLIREVSESERDAVDILGGNHPTEPPTTETEEPRNARTNKCQPRQRGNISVDSEAARSARTKRARTRGGRVRVKFSAAPLAPT